MTHHPCPNHFAICAALGSLSSVALSSAQMTVSLSDPSYFRQFVVLTLGSSIVPPKHLNCMTAKEWIKSQLGVWQFTYSGRDVRDKDLHPATFPISLSKKVIELFSHEGELILDPFVGSGTTLLAAQDLNRNAVGFDLQERYIDLCEQRLGRNNFFNQAQQLAIQDNALHIANYLPKESLSLIWTSPPYANLLNRRRKKQV
jgi:DNA modification methylase